MNLSGDPIFESATSLAQAIRTGEVSSEEVVDAHLRRIAEVNPSLNAVVHIAASSAVAEARAADVRRAVGAAVGALHGVPVTIKDNHDVAGMPCTARSTWPRRGGHPVTLATRCGTALAAASA